MAQSNLGLCYEGIQRIYRNAVVRYLRSCLRQSFPEDCADRLRKPFEKEWEKIKESAVERRQTGEIDSELVDEFDLLGVNHFFNLFDAYYDELCKCASGIEEGQKKKQKQAILQWMKTIKNLRDPLSHPSEEDFSYEDSFILLDCARRVLSRLGLENEAKQLKVVMDELSGRPLSSQPEVEPLEDRLPPRESIVVDFVGRGHELKLLWEWFEDPLSRRWALAGEGGKGKSALAFQFGTQVKFKAPAPFQIVLWLSGKKKRFQEGTVVTLEHPDFLDMDSALSCILADYGWIDETNYPTERKQARVLELFEKFPALVIVDDVDSLEGEDEDAVEFFTFSVPQTKSKVLLTSRRTVFGMGNTTTHVGGFNDEDAERFIFSRFRLMELDPTVLNPGLIREIIRVAEASPLYIEDMIRLFAVQPPREAIKLWTDKGGNEARQYALGRELELLSNQARQVLLAACIRPGAVSFPELEALTGLSGEQITGALAELQRLFLVPKPRLIEGEQRFDVNLNTRALVRKVLGTSDLYKRVEAAHKAVSGTLPKVGRGEVAGIIRQAVFLVKNWEQPKAEQLLLAALEKYVNDPELTGFLGWVYKAWDPTRVTDAREKFKRAYQLKCANHGMYKHWSQMEINEHEWTKAAEAAENGLKLIPDDRLLLFLAGHARGRLARELMARLVTEKAQAEVAKSRALLGRALKAPESLEAGERRLNADIYRALVLNCELLKDANGLQEHFRSWLKEHPDDPDADSEWDRLSRKFGLTSPL